MNPLQRTAFYRKIYYFAAILALFTISMLWRGIIPIPLANSQRAANWVASKSILNQSYALDLRELEQGEPELAGEGARLMLTGSRGFAVAYLWHSAIEAQKRNDFHKMEKRIEAVTNLQPHFITPWIFQSWNITYNVSVEMQGSGDMYFYIARGIELLAEGERRNSHTVKDPVLGERKIGSPDIRYQIAFYYQNKFGVSDQVEVLRCLFQLSCMPLEERNPDRLIDPRTGAVDLVAFQRFCEEHPHLVRRLRGEDTSRVTGVDERARQRLQESLKCPKPDKIVQFLRDNKDIPTRYKAAKELADPDKQFPVLPPKFNDTDAHPGMVTEDDFSAFKTARAWFTYGCLPLPPPPLDKDNKTLPWRTPFPDEYNQIYYRIPRQPLLIIFRQGPPRAQTFQADMEQKEGWFDDDGWQIDDPNDHNPQNWWFPDPKSSLDHPRALNLVVGKKKSWSLEEWRNAAEMWRIHGDQYGLEVSQERLARYEETAKKAPGGAHTLDPTPEQMQSEWFQAAAALMFYHQNRSVTNFPYFRASSEAEAKLDTVRARKKLWQAEQARKVGNKALATRLYEEGLEDWKKVLIANPAFHHPERSDRTDEQTYEYELSYLRLLVQDDERVRVKANEIAGGCRSVVPFLPYPYPQTLQQTQRDANEKVRAAAPPFAPAFLRPFVPVPYPRIPTPAQAAANESASRVRASAPEYVRKFIFKPFPDVDDEPPADTPQWGKDAREEIKWYVAERYDPRHPEESFSPFAGPMKADGTPWIQNDLKQGVRVALGIQRKTPQVPQGSLAPLPTPTASPPGGGN